MKSLPAKQARPSRTTALLLVAAFFGPLLAAVLLYANVGRWYPSSFSNHGELIQPPRPLESFVASNAEGEAVDGALFRGKWTFVHVADNSCGLVCAADLFKTRQVRLAVGRDMGRVQRVYLTTQTDASSEMPNLAEHPGLSVLTLDEAHAGQLTEQLGSAPEGQVYLVDPLGNLMMRYKSESTAKGMLADLKRLLKLSQIG